MHRVRLGGLRIIAVLVLLATPASAQLVSEPLQAGTTAFGSLSMEDPAMGDGTPYRIHTYTGRRGERIRVTLRSTDFNAYLHLGTSLLRLPWSDDRPDATRASISSPVVADNDSGGGSDAMVEYTITESGPIYVVPNTYEKGRSGTYRLLVESLDPGDPSSTEYQPGNAEAPAPEVRMARLGGVVTAELSDSSPRDAGYPVEDFWYRATAGERVSVWARAGTTAIDTYLYFQGPASGTPGPDLVMPTLAEDDDGSGGTDAAMSVKFPQDGLYRFRVRSVTGRGMGEIWLAMLTNSMPEEPTPSPAPSVSLTTTSRPSYSDPEPDPEPPSTWREEDMDLDDYADLTIRGFVSAGMTLEFSDEYEAARATDHELRINDPHAGDEFQLVVLEEGGVAPALFFVYRQARVYGTWEDQGGQGLPSVPETTHPGIYRTGTKLDVSSDWREGDRLRFTINAGASAGYPRRTTRVLLFSR